MRARLCQAGRRKPGPHRRRGLASMRSQFRPRRRGCRGRAVRLRTGESPCVGNPLHSPWPSRSAPRPQRPARWRAAGPVVAAAEGTAVLPVAATLLPAMRSSAAASAGTSSLDMRSPDMRSPDRASAVARSPARVSLISTTAAFITSAFTGAFSSPPSGRTSTTGPMTTRAPAASGTATAGCGSATDRA